jgi:nickel/cobalt transporter (NicO) family protein
MAEALILLATSFWYGALHAIQPGHGKTIAAAYIVGARGRPVDAWILGIFVTLSHTSGIVLVGIVASLGLPGLMPQRIEAWLGVITGILVIIIGLWTLWTQRGLFEAAGWASRTPIVPPVSNGDHVHYRLIENDHNHLHGVAHAHDHAHDHTHPDHAHDHEHAHDAHHTHDHSHGDDAAGYHSHGWGTKHTHNMDLVTTNRPSLWLLIWLGIAGGLLPDPVALTLLLRALAEGKVMLGLSVVLVFSLGFAAVLVIVGVIAAAVGRRILDWLAGPTAARLQIATSLLIVIVGVILTGTAMVKVGGMN